LIFFSKVPDGGGGGARGGGHLQWRSVFTESGWVVAIEFKIVLILIIL
jgi:hypothetical protein